VEAGLKAFRYGVRLSTLRHAAIDVFGRKFQKREARDQYWRSRRLHVEFQSDIFAELLRTRRPDFAATLFKPVDTVSHMHWKYMEPEGFPDVTTQEMDRYGGVIDMLYDEADRAVGKIVRAVPEDADIIVVSDHGFQSAQGSKIVDAYCRIRTENLIDALGMSERLSGTNLDDRVYLRTVGVTEAEGGTVLDQVEKSLGDLHLAGNPNPILEIVRDGRVITLRIRRNIGLRTDLNVVLDDKQYPFDELIRAMESALYSGEHHPDGIYLLSGPSVSRAIDADSLHVLDVAPTVAALLDLPKSPLWPGRAAVEEDGERERIVAEYAPPSVPSDLADAVDEELKDKLRAIGYLE
jgi:arylsulfatase A-like enzyme